MRAPPMDEQIRREIAVVVNYAEGYIADRKAHDLSVALLGVTPESHSSAAIAGLKDTLVAQGYAVEDDPETSCVVVRW